MARTCVIAWTWTVQDATSPVQSVAQRSAVVTVGVTGSGSMSMWKVRGLGPQSPGLLKQELEKQPLKCLTFRKRCVATKTLAVQYYKSPVESSR
ncbi:hypothetical protein MAR_023722 [Mya arenaria]|uniref:Uncharacterized protein n=1 Tax=Mya arenaria TaxID=6604 RepID=A0ABY7DRY3_MYAAR|nr:hypothetical protein MAR_023722 [Mya arenaria]